MSEQEQYSPLDPANPYFAYFQEFLQCVETGKPLTEETACFFEALIAKMKPKPKKWKKPLQNRIRLGFRNSIIRALVDRYKSENLVFTNKDAFERLANESLTADDGSVMYLGQDADSIRKIYKIESKNPPDPELESLSIDKLKEWLLFSLKTLL